MASLHLALLSPFFWWKYWFSAISNIVAFGPICKSLWFFCEGVFIQSLYSPFEEFKYISTPCLNQFNWWFSYLGMCQNPVALIKIAGFYGCLSPKKLYLQLLIHSHWAASKPQLFGRQATGQPTRCPCSDAPCSSVGHTGRPMPAKRSARGGMPGIADL